MVWQRPKTVLEHNSNVSGYQLSEVIERKTFEFVNPDELKNDITFFIMDIKYQTISGNLC